MSEPKIPGSLQTSFARQELVLLPDRAIWWPAASAVVIADLHLGKAASFRMHGIPVPSGSTLRDLTRLTALLAVTAARQLIILGDFLHSRAGRQQEVLDSVARWRATHADLQILLIRGNHDRSAGRALPEWNVQEVEEPHSEHGLTLVHHPHIATTSPALAGHVHPVTSLRDFDGSMVTIPSFIQDPERLILPSFGTFTGGHHMSAEPGRRIFFATKNRVIEKRQADRA